MKFLYLFLPIVILTACMEPSENVHIAVFEKMFVTEGQLPDGIIAENYYVPAYSNLYYRDGDNKSFFTVLLSLRNISYSDTIYFTKADYFDSDGNLLRHYIDSILMLRPMESVEYLVEQAESEGGSGANFVVSIAIQEDCMNKPLIETVMIGATSHHGFAFRSESVLIK